MFSEAARSPTCSEMSLPEASGQVPKEEPDARLRHLFRENRRTGRCHPLFELTKAHRLSCSGGSPTRAALPSYPPAGDILVSLDPARVQQQVANLPHLPQAALRALQTLRREDASLEDVATELGCDASLTARVLRLANSPFYGVAGRVATTRDVIQVLGKWTLQSVLALAAVATQFADSRSRMFSVPAFWRHTLATAILARGLAEEADLDEEQAFVAGLLHNIGLLAMSVHFPEFLDALIARAHAEDASIAAVERSLQLTTHAQLGGWIAAHWHFPTSIATVIQKHDGPSGSTGEVDPLVACVHVANAMAHALDVAEIDDESVPGVDIAAWQAVAPTEAACLDLMTQAQQGVQALCAALSL